MSSFLVALQFLTRLPSPLQGQITLADLSQSVGWFPLVGALLGGLLVALDAAAGRALHPTVVNALLLTILVCVTGALHLDGLIDTADGLASGSDPSSQLAAMHKVHVGPMGAVAGCGLLLALFAALSSLPPALRAQALFVAPTAGRAAILLTYHACPYARPERGLSRALKDGATLPRAGWGLAVAVVLVATLTGSQGLGLLALALAWAVALALLSTRRLGGITGDVQGAICESSQLLVVAVAPALGRL